MELQQLEGFFCFCSACYYTILFTNDELIICMMCSMIRWSNQHAMNCECGVGEDKMRSTVVKMPCAYKNCRKFAYFGI